MLRRFNNETSLSKQKHNIVIIIIIIIIIIIMNSLPKNKAQLCANFKKNSTMEKFENIFCPKEKKNPVLCRLKKKKTSAKAESQVLHISKRKIMKFSPKDESLVLRKVQYFFQRGKSLLLHTSKKKISSAEEESVVLHKVGKRTPQPKKAHNTV